MVYLVMIDNLDLRRSFKLGDTGDNLSFDSALVVSSSDLEEALVSPALIPAVGNQPVRSAAFNTPANNLDSVSSQSRSSSVVINSALVGQEVVVDGEGSLNWTMGHDFSLDLCDLGGDTVDGIGNPSVLVVSSGVAINASGLALRSGLGSSARSVLAAVDVMVARREAVRHAVPGVIVKITSDDTNLFPVVHSAGRIPSVAAVTA